MCPDKSLLSAYFDKELDERFASQIEAHIATCDSCRKVLEGFESVSSVLRGADAPDVASSKTRTWSFLERFAQVYPVPIWKRRLQVPVPVMAAAALVVILLGVGLFLTMSTQRQGVMFDSVTRTHIESTQFVSFDKILDYLDERGSGSTFIFTLPQNTKLQFVSEPTLMKAADYKRGFD